MSTKFEPDTSSTTIRHAIIYANAREGQGGGGALPLIVETYKEHRWQWRPFFQTQFYHWISTFSWPLSCILGQIPIKKGIIILRYKTMDDKLMFNTVA